jgi:hypothetical protein
LVVCDLAALVAADTLWVVGRSAIVDKKSFYGLWGYPLAAEASDADEKAASSKKWQFIEMVLGRRVRACFDPSGAAVFGREIRLPVASFLLERCDCEYLSRSAIGGC